MGVRRTFQAHGTFLAALAALLFAVALSACGPVDKPVNKGPAEVNYWEQRKGDCEQVLMSPQAYEIDRVTQCMKIWETYRTVGDLSVSMRSMYAVAFSMAWYNAQDNRQNYEMAIADAALSRLCIPLHPRRTADALDIDEKPPTKLVCSSKAVGGAEDPGDATPVAALDPATEEANRLAELRGSVATKTPSEKRQKKAKSFNKKGLRKHNKKSYGAAETFYRDALKQYPHYVTAQYNLVCALALMGNDQDALDELEKLYTWDDPEVEARLIKARSDADLTTLHDYIRFKQLTGYFRLILANGTGEIGAATVARIMGELEARRFVIYEVRNTKKPKLNPEIWYKPGFEGYVDKFKTIIGAKKIKVNKIDWDTLDDMIVIWGEEGAAALFEGGPGAPIVQGTRAVDDSNALEDFTNAVGETQGQVEGAKDAGTGAVDAVPAN